jgi:hypothetical protein
MNNENKVLTDDMLTAGLRKAKELKAKNDSATPATVSPMGALKTLKGWETVTIILQKGYSFEETPKLLNDFWKDGLTVINQKRAEVAKNTKEVTEDPAKVLKARLPKTVLVSGPALRRCFHDVLNERFANANADLRRKLPKEKKDAARKVLVETKEFYARFGWEPGKATSDPSGNNTGGESVKKKTIKKVTKPVEPTKVNEIHDVPATEAKPESKTESVAPAPATEPKPLEKTSPPIPPAGPSSPKGNGTKPETLTPDELVLLAAKFKCPKCGAPMRATNGTWGWFLGCSTYRDTKCNGRRKISGKDTTPAVKPNLV